MNKVSIRAELENITDYWSQRIIGEANKSVFKLAKGLGETRWHKHDDQDELFIIYEGHMTIQLRDRTIELDQDDMFIVPRGVEHCPRAEAEVAFMIVGLNITSTAAGGKPNM